MKEILWLFIPTRTIIKQTSGIVFLLDALIITVIYMLTLIPSLEEASQELKTMPCDELRLHILNQDLKGFSLWDQEHQYTWRCEKG